MLVVFAGEGFDLRGGDVAQGAAEDFLFEEVVPPGEIGKLLGDGVVDAFEDALLVLGDAGGDVGFGFAVPGDESGFRDAKPPGDAGEAQGLDTEAEEFVTGGGGVDGDRRVSGLTD